MWKVLGFLTTVLVCIVIIKLLGVLTLIGVIILVAINAWWQVRKFRKKRS